MIQALGPAIEQNLELEFWGHASDSQIGLCVSSRELNQGSQFSYFWKTKNHAITNALWI